MKTHNIISRKQAKELKLKRYFTGKLCKYGHISERDYPSGLCITCRKNHHKAYRDKNIIDIRDKQNKYYKTEKSIESRKTYKKENKDAIRLKRKQFRLDNRKRLSRDAKDYYHKTKHRLENKLYQSLRYGLSRIVTIIQEEKQTRTLDSLPYSIQDLKEHLESLFEDGMSWENHGVYGWHIDHKIPLSKIVKDNLDKSQLELHLLVNKLDNLQPLWARDNLLKGENY